MTPPLVLRVTGDPAPKGSNRAMLIGGKARFVPGGSRPNQAKLGSWKTAVVDAAERVTFALGPGPVAIGLVFRLPLRKGDWTKLGAPKATAPLAVIVKPDVDKLVRSTFDALTTAGAWTDDSQVAICLAAKLYVPPGQRLGADLVIGVIDPTTLVGMGDVHKHWLAALYDAGAAMGAARAPAKRAT